MRQTARAVTVLVFLAVGLGCRPEPRSTTMHEPGVYKGAKDPLLAQQKQQELVDRLNLAQRDR
ncbi:MAG TPA: hypothetical protein VI078_03685 [bacterium]